jgi:hypothetical protein
MRGKASSCAGGHLVGMKQTAYSPVIVVVFIEDEYDRFGLDVEVLGDDLGNGFCKRSLFFHGTSLGDADGDYRHNMASFVGEKSAGGAQALFLHEKKYPAWCSAHSMYFCQTSRWIGAWSHTAGARR